MKLHTPSQVRRAVRLLWFQLLAAIVATFVLFDSATLQAEPEMAMFMGPLLIGSFAFNAIVIVFISRRHNWARIVLFLFTVLGVIVMFWPSPDPEPRSWYSWISDFGFIVLDLVAIYWLFSGAGAKWFSGNAEGAL